MWSDVHQECLIRENFQWQTQLSNNCSWPVASDSPYITKGSISWRIFKRLIRFLPTFLIPGLQEDHVLMKAWVKITHLQWVLFSLKVRQAWSPSHCFEFWMAIQASLHFNFPEFMQLFLCTLSEHVSPCIVPLCIAFSPNIYIKSTL